MRYLLVFITLFIFNDWLTAQQLPLFTQYRENQSIINPASVHTDNIGYSFRPNSSIGVSYRHQWAGLKSGPRTMTARYEHISEDLNMLFGLSLIRDVTGPTSTSGVQLRYAYQIVFSRYALLSIGFSVGVLQSGFDASKGITRDPGDFKGLSEINAMYLDYNPGVFYRATLESDDDFYAGISFPQLLSTKLSKVEDELFLERKPHIFAQVGLYKYLGDGFGFMEGSLFLEPSVWLKYVNLCSSSNGYEYSFSDGGMFFG